MMVSQSDSIRMFFGSFSNSNKGEVDLNQLVLRYRETKNSEDFALICNKVLGIITFFAKKVKNPHFTEADCYSHGLETLHIAIDKWDSTRNGNASFQTYFYRLIHNKFYTLENLTKVYKRPRVEESLDALLGNFTKPDYAKYLAVCDNLPNRLTMNKCFQENNICYKILKAVESYNVYKPRDLREMLGITQSELKKAVKSLEKSLSKLV